MSAIMQRLLRRVRPHSGNGKFSGAAEAAREHLRAQLDPAQQRSEAFSSARNQAWANLERAVEDEIKRGRSDELSAVVHAQLATKLQNWEAAIVRWKRVAREVPSWRDRAHYQLAVGYRNIGSTARATAAIMKAQPRGLSQAQIDAETNRIGAWETAELIRALGNRLVDFLDSGQDAPQHALISAVSAIASDGVIAKTLAAIEEVATKPQTPSQPPGTAEPRRTIFLCGFGWSGSGALFDYYRQSSQVLTPFGKTELAAFERDTSAREIVRVAGEQPADLPSTVVKFVLGAVLGIAGPATVSATKTQRASLRAALRGGSATVSDDILADALADLARYLVTRSSAVTTESEALNLVREAFRRLFASIVPHQSVSLLSNCVTAANIDGILYVPGSRAVVVRRDVRDQYVAQRYEYTGREGMSVRKFVEKVRGREETYRAALARLEDASSLVREIWFDDFVMDELARADLESWLGVPAPTSSQAGYSPEMSIKNVGLQRSYPKRREIELIERELPWLCRVRSAG